MRIDKEKIGAELRKKNKREKINRLKRLGDLKLEKITDYAVFSAVFDELSSQNDFRKGAVYNASYFQKNNLYKEFLLSLFELDLLHATVLKVGNEIIASNVGTMGNKWVHLQGINTHSPAHSKYSPGILHFLMMGQLLADEEFDVFDLTPGSDAYKDILATDYLEVHQLTITNPTSLLLEKLKYKGTQKVKLGLNKLGIKDKSQKQWKKNVEVLAEKIEFIKSEGFLPLWNWVISRIGTIYPPRFYEIKEGMALDNSLKYVIAKQSLQELLKYEQKNSLLIRWEFLEDAMKRLEEGQLFFTISDGNRLLCCVWRENYRELTNSSKTPVNEKETVKLTNLYYHSDAKNLIKDFLPLVVREIFRESKSFKEYALLGTTDRRTAAVLEKSGFRYTVG